MPRVIKADLNTGLEDFIESEPRLTLFPSFSSESFIVFPLELDFVMSNTIRHILVSVLFSLGLFSLSSSATSPGFPNGKIYGVNLGEPFTMMLRCSS